MGVMQSDGKVGQKRDVFLWRSEVTVLLFRTNRHSVHHQEPVCVISVLTMALHAHCAVGCTFSLLATSGGFHCYCFACTVKQR